MDTMRKIVAPILIGLGTCLLVAGLIASFWAPDEVKKTPLDVDSVTWLSGEGARLDPATGELDVRPVWARSTTKTDADASTEEIAVFTNTTCALYGDAPTEAEAGEIVEAEKSGEAPPVDTGQCLPHDDPKTVNVSAEAFAADRTTALSVDHGELPGDPMANVADAVQTEGIVNKWPFDAEKRTYPYWDGVVGRAVDAAYDRTEEVDGLETYVYVVDLEDEPIQISDDVEGTYTDHKEIFVDPRTGAIIRQVDDQQRYLADGKQVLELRLEFTDYQVAQNVEDAKANGDRLTLLSSTVPRVGIIGGVVLLAVGGALLLTGRRGKKRHTEERELESAGV